MTCVLYLVVHICTYLPVEEEMFAKLWEEDIRAKARREEMEATLQIERNREQLKVMCQTIVAASN